MINLILLIFAFVLALINAFWGFLGRPSGQPWPKPHLGWLAFAIYLLTLILGGAGIR
jgi:hypothetical protein